VNNLTEIRLADHRILWCVVVQWDRNCHRDWTETVHGIQVFRLFVKQGSVQRHKLQNLGELYVEILNLNAISLGSFLHLFHIVVVSGHTESIVVSLFTW